MRDLQAQSPRPKHKAFKACEPGCLHVDVKERLINAFGCAEMAA